MSDPQTQNGSGRKPADARCHTRFKMADLSGDPFDKKPKFNAIDLLNVILLPTLGIPIFESPEAVANNLVLALLLGAATMRISYRLFRDRLAGIDQSKVNDSFGFVSFVFLLTMATTSTWAAILASLDVNSGTRMTLNATLLFFVVGRKIRTLSQSTNVASTWTSGGTIFGIMAALLPVIFVTSHPKAISGCLACFAYGGFVCLILMARKGRHSGAPPSGYV